MLNSLQTDLFLLLIIALVGGLLGLNSGKDGTKSTGDFTEPFFGILILLGIPVLLLHC